MTGKTLWEVYKNPSEEKIKAWNKINNEIVFKNGFNIMVHGSTYSFSVMYNYYDNAGYLHLVYETKDNSTDTILYRYKDVKAVYADSAYSGIGILNIIGGEFCVSCFIFEQHIDNIRKTRIHYSLSGKPYIIRGKRKLYLDNFLKI